jgi:hypothetical protein
MRQHFGLMVNLELANIKRSSGDYWY